MVRIRLRCDLHVYKTPQKKNNMKKKTIENDKFIKYLCKILRIQ